MSVDNFGAYITTCMFTKINEGVFLFHANIVHELNFSLVYIKALKYYSELATDNIKLNINKNQFSSFQNHALPHLYRKYWIKPL